MPCGPFGEVSAVVGEHSGLARVVLEYSLTMKRLVDASKEPGFGVVFLELEERCGAGEGAAAVNSVSVYEFDVAGKIRHLDIYLQMPMPGGAMPKAYE
jgi:hypothetical protein